MFTQHPVEFWKNKYEQDRINKLDNWLSDHQTKLDQIAKDSFPYSISECNKLNWAKSWLMVALANDHKLAANKLLDALNVPNNMTVEQRVAYVSLFD